MNDYITTEVDAAIVAAIGRAVRASLPVWLGLFIAACAAGGVL